jgi:hypothetical protein
VSNGGHLDSVGNAFFLNLEKTKFRAKAREEASQTLHPRNGALVGRRGRIIVSTFENKVSDSGSEIPDIRGIPVEKVENLRIFASGNDDVISYTIPSISSV